MRVADDALRELRRQGEWRELDDLVEMVIQTSRYRQSGSTYPTRDELPIGKDKAFQSRKGGRVV
jgi:hypothetical protein